MAPFISDSAETFLKSQPNLILGTIRRDGSPQASPLWYLWTGTAFIISTVDTTAKWANLRRDPRCSICVDEPSTGQMVVAYGTARLKESDVEGETRSIVDKYYPGEPDKAEAHIKRIFENPKRRVIIEVEPDEMITRKLD